MHKNAAFSFKKIKNLPGKRLAPLVERETQTSLPLTPSASATPSRNAKNAPCYKAHFRRRDSLSDRQIYTLINKKHIKFNTQQCASVYFMTLIQFLVSQCSEAHSIVTTVHTVVGNDVSTTACSNTAVLSQQSLKSQFLSRA